MRRRSFEPAPVVRREFQPLQPFEDDYTRFVSYNDRLVKMDAFITSRLLHFVATYTPRVAVGKWGTVHTFFPYGVGGKFFSQLWRRRSCGN